MSWSCQVHPPVAVADFHAAASEALAKATPTIVQNNPDGLEAAALALSAAINLVDMRIVGDGQVVAYLQGHGNPDHVAPPGWSKDMVTITLHRADK